MLFFLTLFVVRAPHVDWKPRKSPIRRWPGSSLFPPLYVKSLKIDTYHPPDPHLKRYIRALHKKRSFTALAALNHFKDPQTDMHYRLWTLI